MRLRKALASLGAGALIVCGLAAVNIQAADAASYINIKNSVNSDSKIRCGNTYSDVWHTLYPGEDWSIWDGDGGARCYIYWLDGSIDSYQYYYDGTWKSCHENISSNWTNPASESSVTLRTFYSSNCDGRN